MYQEKEEATASVYKKEGALSTRKGKEGENKNAKGRERLKCSGVRKRVWNAAKKKDAYLRSFILAKMRRGFALIRKKGRRTVGTKKGAADPTHDGE